MKTTTATLRTFRVARLIPNGLRHTAIQATAHFRLAIAATSAGPFRLHGGRA